MNKRGQFYLVAAVIIAIVIFSLASVSNYVKPKERKTAVFDIGAALNFESGKVVAYTQMRAEDTWSFVENYIRIVMNSSDSQNIGSWFIVYGDPNNMTMLTFTSEDAGKDCLGAGGVECPGLTTSRKVMNKTSIDYGSSVNITLNNMVYNFDMTKGNNFAFLIKDENYVSSSSETTTSTLENECEKSGGECKENECENYGKSELTSAKDKSEYCKGGKGEFCCISNSGTATT